MKEQFTDWTPGLEKTRRLLAQVEGVVVTVSCHACGVLVTNPPQTLM